MMKKVLILIISAITIISFSGVSFAQDSTESADSVREKVKEKIQKVMNKPKAFLGTITDKTGETLQIKNTSGEIQFISVIADDTVFVSVGKTTKSIEYEEVALGDFLIAMGYISAESESSMENGNSVLEAKRILVTEEVKPPEREIAFGNVKGIDKKILTLNTGESDIEFEFPKRWKGPEIDEISENDRVAIVGVPNEGKTYIRTMEIITEGNSTTSTSDS